MALITINRLFVDVEQNRAYSQFGSFSVARQPFFIQGDQCPVELSLVRQTGVQGAPFEPVAFDGSSTFNLKIGNTTLVATSTTTAVTPTAPDAYVTNLVGYISSGWEVNRLYLTPKPYSGFFTISVTNPAGGVFNSNPIDINATALDIKTAITAFGTPYTDESVMVTKTGQFTWEVSFKCSLLGIISGMGATGSSGLIPFDSRVMTLDMTTAGVATLLNGAAQVEATLEFSVDTSGDTQTFLYIPCTVINDL